MIKMAKEKSEEKSTQGIQINRQELRWNFWKMNLDELRKRGA